MGDNANVAWDWHNTVVGEGYQARGVVRQAVAGSTAVRVVDMSRAQGSGAVDRPKTAGVSMEDKEKETHKKTHKKSSKRESKPSSARRSKPRKMFNPLLQQFAATLSDTTRSFTVH